MVKVLRVSNSGAEDPIRRRVPFTNGTGSLRGEDSFGSSIEYLVYSYATVIAYYDRDAGWFVNRERFSPTTTQHQNTVRYAVGEFRLY